MTETLPSIDPVDVHVGNRLRARRREMDVSQSDLGEALGITFQQIQKYEKGSNRVSASMLVRAARKLQVTPAWFFEGLPESDAKPESAEQAQARLWALGDGAPLVIALSRLDLESREIVTDLVYRMRLLAAGPAPGRKVA